MAGRRFEELDGLRGIAALWVVAFHLTYADAIALFGFNLKGTMAVDLFFVVSGFVILMTVERSASVRAFAVSRFARLYPTYWVAVLISTAVAFIMPLPSAPVTGWMALVNLTMLQDYLAVPAVDPSYWSLTYELGFYALMAVGLRAGLLGHIEALGLAWVSISAVLAAMGAVSFWRLQALLALPYAALFCAGIVFYRIRSEGFSWPRAGLIGLCLVVRIFQLPGEAIITVAIFAVFALAVADRLPLLRCRPLLFLGTISYALYVVHQPLGLRLQIAFQTLGFPRWLNYAATLAILVGVAAFMTFAIERPAGRRLRRALGAAQAQGVFP